MALGEQHYAPTANIFHFRVSDIIIKLYRLWGAYLKNYLFVIAYFL